MLWSLVYLTWLYYDPSMYLNNASTKILIQIFYRQTHEFDCKVIGLDLKRNERASYFTCEMCSFRNSRKCKNKQALVDQGQVWGTTQIGLAFIEEWRKLWKLWLQERSSLPVVQKGIFLPARIFMLPRVIMCESSLFRASWLIE